MVATKPTRLRFPLLAAAAVAATVIAGGHADVATAAVGSAQHVIPATPHTGNHVSSRVSHLPSRTVLRAKLVHNEAARPVARAALRRATRRGALRVRPSQLPGSSKRPVAAARARKNTKPVLTTTQDSNPLAGAKLYVDPNSNARRQADAWRQSRPEDAAQMDKIAAQSSVDWFGDWNLDIRAAVDGRVSAITAAGALPVLVAYNIPLSDCAGYSAGGASSPDAYRRWIREFAAGIGTRGAVVILEPDSLAALDCLTSDDRTARLALLKDAVDVLSAHAKVSTYIDAGNSAWVSAPEMAQRLTSVGVAKARGFALNVSNYRWTSESTAYGRAVSDAIGGKSFVVDTSRNGLGPTADSQWCNADGRALGPVPKAAPDSRVDAFLWIKPPGESDGTCNGGPSAGAWWGEYALGLAQRASQ